MALGFNRLDALVNVSLGKYFLLLIILASTLRFGLDSTPTPQHTRNVPNTFEEDLSR